jgi:hypothetical protein
VRQLTVAKVRYGSEDGVIAWRACGKLKILGAVLHVDSENEVRVNGLKHQKEKRSMDHFAALKNPAYHFKRIGLDAGPLSEWLYALAEAEMPVICVESRHCERC